jgi:hypothetical protein
MLDGKEPIMNVITIVFALALAQHSAMPPGMSHEEHLKQMQKEADLKARGEAAMGFDQAATSHHFAIAPEGGAIEVSVTDASDRANRDAIRAHLKTIAGQFAAGVFEAPFATHAEVPPGVAEMQRLKASIAYRYEQTAGGGRVRIVTKDAAARAAVHEFLRYQIREHKTGDPGVR